MCVDRAFFLAELQQAPLYYKRLHTAHKMGKSFSWTYEDCMKLNMKEMRKNKQFRICQVHISKICLLIPKPQLSLKKYLIYYA